MAIFVVPAEAQSRRPRETVYSSQTVDGIALQPFSFNREPQGAQPIQVAYYVPRPARQAEPIQRDEYDSEARPPGFDIGGFQPSGPPNNAGGRERDAYAPLAT